MVLLAASATNLIYNFWLYSAYLFFLLVITISIEYYPKTSKKAIDEFFAYTKKGRKGVAKLGDFLLYFFITQLLYIFFFLILSFWLYFIISLPISYTIALYSESFKKHRHNGIQIGYECPHPIGMETTQGVTLEGKVQPATVKISTSGSKGIYDLQTKSEPNPHTMLIGESGSGKTNLTLTFLTRSYSKFGIPFLIMDWPGSYKHSGIDVNTWRVPTNLKINPFPLRGMSIERRAGIASELLQVSLALTDLQAQKVRETLVDMYN